MIVVAIAAYNEGSIIGDVVRGLHDGGYEHVVVVDDGSKDDTFEKAHNAGAFALRHAINRGQGAALQTAIDYGLVLGAETIVTFDADGQHRVEDIQRLLAPIKAGDADIALGSRFLEDADAVPIARRLLLSGAILFTRLTSGIRLTDSHNGLRAFSARAASQIHLQMDRMAHASEIIDQILESDLPYCEVPVRIEYTEYSRAKGQTGSAAARVAFDYLVGRFWG